MLHCMLTIPAKIPFAEISGEIIVLPINFQSIHIVVGLFVWNKQLNIL